MTKKVQGVHVLPPTPWTASGEIDEAGYRKAIEFCLENGVEGITVAGRTGEFMVMSMAERQQLIEIAVDQVRGRALVGSGLMALETDEAIKVVRFVERAGGDYVMASPPYPPGETKKMLAWYRAVANATDISIMAYDCVYGPWGEERLSTEEVIVPLAGELENLTATKTTDPPISVRVLKQNTDLSVLCGWTAMMLLHYQYGADGMLVGNPAIMPKENVAFDRAMRDGDVEAGRDIFYRQIAPVINWCAIPYAASALKQVFVWRGFYANSDVRLPFEPLPEDRARELHEACKWAGTL